MSLLAYLGPPELSQSWPQPTVIGYMAKEPIKEGSQREEEPQEDRRASQGPSSNLEPTT